MYRLSGKSDHSLPTPPDLSGAVAESMYSVPGHNKYDLTFHSNLQLRAAFRWGTQDLSSWAEQHYVSALYKGITLFLQKNSAAVKWDKLSDIKPLSL
jgi:hypothetical protein